MARIYLIHPSDKEIFFTEQLYCHDKDMILVKDDDGETFRVPKCNIAYIGGSE